MRLTSMPRSFLSADAPRVWVRRRGNPNMVMYCNGSLWLGSLPAGQHKQAIAQFNGGASPLTAIGPTAREIALICVERVEADLRHRWFTFEHGSQMGTARTSFQLADVSDAHELTGILRARLGVCFSAEPIGLNLLWLLGPPLALFAALMGLIGGLWYLGQPGVMARSHPTARWLANLHDQQLMMVAAVGAAVMGIWALMRLFTRPRGLVFRRGQSA